MRRYARAMRGKKIVTGYRTLPLATLALLSDTEELVDVRRSVRRCSCAATCKQQYARLIRHAQQPKITLFIWMGTVRNHRMPECRTVLELGLSLLGIPGVRHVRHFGVRHSGPLYPFTPFNLTFGDF